MIEVIAFAIAIGVPAFVAGLLFGVGMAREPIDLDDVGPTESGARPL